MGSLFAGVLYQTARAAPRRDHRHDHRRGRCADHICDVVSHLPEAGEETPMMRAGGTDVTIEDMVEAFGATLVPTQFIMSLRKGALVRVDKLMPQVEGVYM